MYARPEDPCEAAGDVAQPAALTLQDVASTVPGIARLLFERAKRGDAKDLCNFAASASCLLRSCLNHAPCVLHVDANGALLHGLSRFPGWTHSPGSHAVGAGGAGWAGGAICVSGVGVAPAWVTDLASASRAADGAAGQPPEDFDEKWNARADALEAAEIVAALAKRGAILPWGERRHGGTDAAREALGVVHLALDLGAPAPDGPAVADFAFPDLVRVRVTNSAPGACLRLDAPRLQSVRAAPTAEPFVIAPGLASLEELSLPMSYNLTRDFVPRDVAGTLRALDVTACPLGALPSGMHGLRSLVARSCIFLARIPADLGSLESLDVSGCESMVQLPARSCRRLVRLNASDTAIDEFPDGMSRLEVLVARTAPPAEVPASAAGMHPPEECDFNGPLRTGFLPAGSVAALRVLDVSFNTGVERLPPGMTLLEELSVTGCTGLTDAHGGGADGESFLPDSSARSLKRLRCAGCPGLSRVPDSATSLQVIDASGCTAFQNHFLPDGAAPHVRALTLRGCRMLTKLPEGLTSLAKLDATACAALRDGFLAPCSAASVKTLVLSLCPLLTRVPGGLQSLEVLDLRGCVGMRDGFLSDAGCAPRLRKLVVSRCPKLTTLPEGMSALAELHVVGATGLREGWMPDSSAGALQDVMVGGGAPLSPCAALPSAFPFGVRVHIGCA
ncbi:unnamed protein product [Pedinophyceae sp. YPF-701]|nr:unnamed protein product [Pedinophyceae sp. YPF-701]